MKTAKKVILGIFGAAAAFFVTTFTIYFFNLDSKALSLLEEPLLKHYEKVDKKKTTKNL